MTSVFKLTSRPLVKRNFAKFVKFFHRKNFAAYCSTSGSNTGKIKG